MNSQSTKDKSIEFGTIITIAAAYAVFVSALYLYGYWSAFKLNVFEYLSLSDLLTHAIFPFFGQVALIVAAVLIVPLIAWLWPWLGRRLHKTIEKEEWNQLVLLNVVLAVILIALVGWFGSEPYKWLSIALLITSFGLPLRGIDYIRALLPDSLIRNSVIFVVVSIPGWTFAISRQNAWNIKHGNGALVVDPRGSALQLSVDHHPVSYLGRLGDFFVLYEVASDRLIIVRADKLESLALIPAGQGLTKNNSR